MSWARILNRLFAIGPALLVMGLGWVQDDLNTLLVGGFLGVIAAIGVHADEQREVQP